MQFFVRSFFIFENLQFAHHANFLTPLHLFLWLSFSFALPVIQLAFQPIGLSSSSPAY
jgi:hypothetical protein